METARLAWLGYELPGAPVDDATLARGLDCPVAKVSQRSGGRLRYFAPDGQGPADLASVVARRMLAETGRVATDIDLIVFTTNTPDIVFPGSACLLQGLLETEPLASLDVRSQCTGFLTALDVARRFVATGSCHRVLLAAGEVFSHKNRYDGEDLDLACRMGDGAAVALIESGAGSGTVLASLVCNDGSRYDEFWCEFPAGRHRVHTGVARGERITREAINKGLHFPRADLAAMRRTALARLPDLLRRACQQARVAALDATLVAHLDRQTENELAGALGPRAGRLVFPDLLYTMAASLPLSLARSLESGAVAVGQTVGLVTAGSGASWGAGVLRL